MFKSKFQEKYCWHCCQYTKQKYLGRSEKSCNDIFDFLKFKVYECTVCGKLNEH